jgi:hypothetical protein
MGKHDLSRDVRDPENVIDRRLPGSRALEPAFAEGHS